MSSPRSSAVSGNHFATPKWQAPERERPLIHSSALLLLLRMTAGGQQPLPASTIPHLSSTPLFSLFLEAAGLLSTLAMEAPMSPKSPVVLCHQLDLHRPKSTFMIPQGGPIPLRDIFYPLMLHFCSYLNGIFKNYHFLVMAL